MITDLLTKVLDVAPPVLAVFLIIFYLMYLIIRQKEKNQSDLAANVTSMSNTLTKLVTLLEVQTYRNDGRGNGGKLQ